MDSYLGGVALDLDLGDAGVIQLLLQDLAEVVVLYEGISEHIVSYKPAGVPVLDYTNTKTVRIYFLTHSLPPLPVSLSL